MIKPCSSRRPGEAVGACRGKLLSPERRRRAVVGLEDRFRVSQRRACRLTGQHRNTQRCPVPLADIEEQKLRRRIRELARRHVRWGRRLVYQRLRPDSWSVNHKRVQRIWREEGLQRPLPRRRKRSRPSGGGRELLRSEYPHHVWAIDFQFDQTMDGRSLKFLRAPRRISTNRKSCGHKNAAKEAAAQEYIISAIDEFP